MQYRLNLSQYLAGTSRVLGLAAISLAIGNLTGTVCADGVQWAASDGGNGHWYMAFDSSGGSTWAEARELATSRGGYLASITSQEEDAWVYENLDAYDRWIGAWQDTEAADYAEPDGGWRWLNGEPWSYSNWNGTIPDNNDQVESNEEYAHYCCGGAWNDIYDASNSGVPTRKQLLIEFSADCNGDGIVDYGQILDGTMSDQDDDGVPDICQDSPQAWVWGNNADGQCDVPNDLGEVVEIAGQGSHLIALRSDGTVICWGRNTDGQCNVPANVDLCIDVAAGDQHTVALRADGTVACWGSNVHGQVSVPDDLEQVIAIGAGANHTIAVLHDGTVRAWGYNHSGAIDPPFNLDGAVAVVGGAHHSAALRSDGTVVAWGGINGEDDVPADLMDVVEIKSSNYNTIALTDTGSIVAWGRNWFGQAEVPADLDDCTSIGIGHEFAMALTTTGAIACWGNAASGECQVPDTIGVVNALGNGGLHAVAWFQTPLDCDRDGVPDNCGNSCAGDINADGVVDGGDLGILLGMFGQGDLFPAADLDNDGDVRGSDLGILLGNWGSCD